MRIGNHSPEPLAMKRFFLHGVFWAGLFLTLLALGYTTLFFNKIYPGVHVAEIDVSGKTREEAATILSSVRTPSLSFISDTPKIQFSLADIGITYDYKGSAENAYNIGRKSRFEQRLVDKVDAFTQKPNLPLVFTLNDEALENIIADLSEQITIPPTPTSLTIEKGLVVVQKGKDGVELDRDQLRKTILEHVAYSDSETIPLPLIITNSHLDEQESNQIQQRAQNLVGKSVKVSIDYQSFTYSASDILPLLAVDGFREDKLDLLVNTIAKTVDVLPQDARLVFEEGKVKEFAPGKDGLATDKEALKINFRAAIENLITTDKKQFEIAIPATRTKPQVETGDVNSLGIKELIGRGTSRFQGSIAGRVHNIALAASRINGLLIKPGDTFSFNNALGDVSAYTGYQQAYIISGGKTILGDGGGVCQVSTTLFRAALNAGLPITERHAHAYRVHYYEEDTKPGIDATVYSPSVDFKIKNDTPTNILIQTTTDTKNLTLTFELYGTSDGRISQIVNHRIWDVVPAPPPLYQDDPTLEPGVIKQIDFSAPGTKAAFDYKVARNGEVLQNRTFYSNYRPWQAIYLRGTTPQ